MDFQQIIDKIYAEIKPFIGKGYVASYIPALAKIETNKIGIAVATVDGNIYKSGNAGENFSIQSISKVFTLVMAFQKLGNELWNRVGKEPSGNAFNSLVHLEYENGKPRNPFVNGGALVITDILTQMLSNPSKEILEFVRKVSGNNRIDYNKGIAASELETSDRNFALSYFMKSYSNIESNIDELMHNYTHQCSIEMSCIDLAKSFLFLANHGYHKENNEQLLTMSQAKRVNSIMITSGLYNESGDFAFRVGMPAKSGVGGGIVAIIPQKLAIACWSPELNEFGNSLIGIEVMERFTTYSGISIF
jgi:glutaminase